MNKNKWQTTFLMAWHTLPYPYVHRVMLWRAIEFNCFDTLIFVQAKPTDNIGQRDVKLMFLCHVRVTYDLNFQFAITHRSLHNRQQKWHWNCVARWFDCCVLVSRNFQRGSLFCFSRSPDVTHIFWAISNRKTNRNKNPFFVWKQCALNLSSYT